MIYKRELPELRLAPKVKIEVLLTDKRLFRFKGGDKFTYHCHDEDRVVLHSSDDPDAVVIIDRRRLKEIFEN